MTTRSMPGRRTPVATGVLAILVSAQCACSPAPPASVSRTVPPAGPLPAASTVEPVTAGELGASWHPGCPGQPGQLRRVGVEHRGFDGRSHRGELIVHEELVAQVVATFEALYQQGYPIERIRTVEQYRGADDELSMEDNNTSAFSCRTIPGSGHWALHAYGRAVDLNPRLNPYRETGGAFQPTNAAKYLDRDRTDPGILHDGDPAVRAFTDRGWRWGGHWHSPIDYQHFERD